MAYALLPRIAGADMTIYPAYDAGYLMSKADCVSVAVECRQTWEQLLPTMPAIGGRMTIGRIAELAASLSQDVVFLLGSRLQQDPREIVAAVDEVQRLQQSF